MFKGRSKEAAPCHSNSLPSNAQTWDLKQATQVATPMWARVCLAHLIWQTQAQAAWGGLFLVQAAAQPSSGSCPVPGVQVLAVPALAATASHLLGQQAAVWATAAHQQRLLSDQNLQVRTVGCSHVCRLEELMCQKCPSGELDTAMGR